MLPSHPKSLAVGRVGAALTRLLLSRFPEHPMIGWGLVAGVGIVLFLTVEWRERRSNRPRLAPPVDSATLPAPTRDELRAAIEDTACGERRYAATSSWNEREGQAYLNLRLRDAVPSQGYRVCVFDPSGIRS